MEGNMVRWEPMREMLSLREAMDKLFEESFVGPQWRSLWSADDQPARQYTYLM